MGDERARKLGKKEKGDKRRNGNRSQMVGDVKMVGTGTRTRTRSQARYKVYESYVRDRTARPRRKKEKTQNDERSNKVACKRGAQRVVSKLGLREKSQNETEVVIVIAYLRPR